MWFEWLKGLGLSDFFSVTKSYNYLTMFILIKFRWKGSNINKKLSKQTFFNKLFDSHGMYLRLVYTRIPLNPLR